MARVRFTVDKIKLNRAGFVALRHAPAVVADLEARAAAIAAHADAGVIREADVPHHWTDSASTGNRHRVAVGTRSIESRMAEHYDGNLTASMDAGG